MVVSTLVELGRKTNVVHVTRESFHSADLADLEKLVLPCVDVVNRASVLVVLVVIVEGPEWLVKLREL